MTTQANASPPSAPTFVTQRVLEYQLAPCTMHEATDWCLRAAKGPGSKLVVTLNPEIIVQAEHHPRLKDALKKAELTVADGVGVLWAAKRFGPPLPERIPGVELMNHILAQGGHELKVFFLGAKPGVAEQAAKNAQARYGTAIAGSHHGYFKRPEEIPHVTQLVRESGADLLLAGLGEGQEQFLHEQRQALTTPLMIGVGGALDVLSGQVERTPAWTRKLGVEWVYRVGLDPKRWHRVPRLLAFVKLVYQRGATTPPQARSK